MPYKDHEVHKEYQRTHSKRKRRAFKLKCLDYAGGRQCTACGYGTSVSALAFHHPNEDKEFSLGKATARTLEWSAVITEIEKCVVLCANCHAEAHDSFL